MRENEQRDCTEMNNEEIQTLNQKLFEEFLIVKLEERLETDPLVIGGLLGMIDTDSLSQIDGEGCTFCIIKTTCTEQTVCAPNT